MWRCQNVHRRILDRRLPANRTIDSREGADAYGKTHFPPNRIYPCYSQLVMLSQPHGIKYFTQNVGFISGCYSRLLFRTMYTCRSSIMLRQSADLHMPNRLVLMMSRCSLSVPAKCQNTPSITEICDQREVPSIFPCKDRGDLTDLEDFRILMQSSDYEFC